MRKIIILGLFFVLLAGCDDDRAIPENKNEPIQVLQGTIDEFCYDGTVYIRRDVEFTAKVKHGHFVSCDGNSSGPK